MPYSPMISLSLNSVCCILQDINILNKGNVALLSDPADFPKKGLLGGYQRNVGAWQGAAAGPKSLPGWLTWFVF